MSDQSRSLPEQPNLRFLKVEAKRRLAAGEFTTLHDAQLAVAREHGMSSWAALKAAIEAAQPESHALTQVRWLVDRFRHADSPTWATPTDAELREHFDDHYLSMVPSDTMITALRGVAPSLREDIEVAQATPQRVRALIHDVRVEAMTETEPPHRLTSLRMYPVGERVTDTRTAEPANAHAGDVPERAIDVLADSFAELGLAGLVLAGADGPRSPAWAVARGWADLDQPRQLLTDHRFPAFGASKLITSTAVLRLVADGAVDLDGRANAYLRTLRLADDDVTVRELLSHTSGVLCNPQPVFADRVPGDIVAQLGAIVPSDGERGTFAAGNGAYAVLGQLVADVTGTAYPDAMARMVFAPLGMTASTYPTRWPDTGTDAVTVYVLGADGVFEPISQAQVHTLPAAGGLWTTAPDLVRFGQRWSSLLPDELSREAVRPHAAQRVPGADVGLGWVVNEAKHVAGHPATGPGISVSLIVRQDTGAVGVALTNRAVPIEAVNARLMRPIV